MNNIEHRDWIGEHLQIGQEWLYLSLEDCKATGVTEGEIFELTERALAAHGRKEVEMPAKIGLHPQPDSLMHAMPAYVPSEFACGMKWAANFPTNAERFPDLVPTSGLLIFNDDRNLGNILYTLDDCRLWMIDHSRSFRIKNHFPRALKSINIRLSDEFVQKLRKLEYKSLHTKMSKYITDQQIMFILKRRDLILRKWEEKGKLNFRTD